MNQFNIVARNAFEITPNGVETPISSIFADAAANASNNITPEVNCGTLGMGM